MGTQYIKEPLNQKKEFFFRKNPSAQYIKEFPQVSESISAVTLIYDQKLHKEIKSFFNRNDVLEEELNLAAVNFGKSAYAIVYNFPMCLPCM